VEGIDSATLTTSAFPSPSSLRNGVRAFLTFLFLWVKRALTTSMMNFSSLTLNGAPQLSVLKYIPSLRLAVKNLLTNSSKVMPANLLRSPNPLS